MRVEDWQNSGFGIYVHWPFCASKCPYCDFNSHVVAHVDQEAWREALVAELEATARLTGPRPVRSVFFGGGTPSLMPVETVAAGLDTIATQWHATNDMEVTLEANPSSTDATRFAGYRAAGVNRLSLGVQALDDASLKKLGRLHSAAEARQAIEIAQSLFTRASFDLIYARQEQTLEDWQRELSEALDLAMGHLSLYQLTIEEGTAFGDRFAAGGLTGLPSEDLAADLYQATQDLCSAAGYPAYEISNHAQDGAASRHNLIYWTGGDYAGVGPGAHGRLTLEGQRRATACVKAPQSWLKKVTEDGLGWEDTHALSGQDQALEYLMMGLRISSGIQLDRYNALASEPLPKAALDWLEGERFVERGDGTLRLTPKGQPVLNAVLRSLIG
ncbi:MAG: radical SAM family heme chaperone HemW [Pseudomonadota bacterium]